MKNVHFAIPEIYGETLSYYELLRKLVNKMNELIENYNTVPEQIAEAVANLDASQLFSAALNQLINSIATDNTKSANAVKVYKKHDLLYATFNETVNLYESLINFTTGTETELIIGTNIREVNISELFIELRELIDDETKAREQGDTTLQQSINAETSARQQADTTLQQSINAETSARQRADTTLQNKIDGGTLIVNILWNNPDPHNDFDSKIININVNEYKIIMFVMLPLKGNLNNNATYPFVASVKENRMNLNYYSAEKTYSRGFSIKDNGNISFGDATENGITNNGAFIPYQIYGIK